MGDQQLDERRRIEKLLWKEKMEGENHGAFPTLTEASGEDKTSDDDEQIRDLQHERIVQELNRILLQIQREAEEKQRREESDRHLVEQMERQRVMDEIRLREEHRRMGEGQGVMTIQQKMEEERRRQETER